MLQASKKPNPTEIIVQHPGPHCSHSKLERENFNQTMREPKAPRAPHPKGLLKHSHGEYPWST